MTRAIRVRRWSAASLVASAIVTPMVLADLLDTYTHLEGFGWWAIFLISTYFLVRLVYGTLTFFVILFIYGRDLEGVKTELYGEGQVIEKKEEPPPNTSMELTVQSLGPVVGRFLDESIFEHIFFVCPDGKVRKATFEGTMDFNRGASSPLPPDTLLLPPGILYKFEEESAG